MSTENKLQVLQAKEIMTLAEQFANSGMFTDAKQMAQAFVKIQAGQEIGLPPFASMTGIHIIQGKPTIGAGLIASAVKGSGKYDYKVVEMTDKNCSIDFYQGSDMIGNSSFSVEDAKKAQTKNLDKFPKNMLFARAISNGVKWFAPDVFSGPVYTPEEMESVNTPSTIDTTYEVVTDVETESEQKKIVEDPVKEMEAVNTLEELKEIWTKHKSLQKDKSFEYMKNKRKHEIEQLTQNK